MRGLIPTLPEIGRETLVILAGAVLAALIVGQIPGLRAWMRAQWQDAPMPLP